MRFDEYDGYSVTLRKDQFKELLIEILIEHREPFIAALKGYVHELYQQDIEAPLNLSDAAKYINVSRQCLSGWIKKGYVPSKKVGKFQMIEKKELMQAIKERNLSTVNKGRINCKWGSKSVQEVYREYNQKHIKPITKFGIQDDD